jgi:hypothetical protein
MDDNSYPRYRRRDNGQTFVKGGFEYDNRWIVPYNPYLSARYAAHINVEIASTITAVKYLYKYIYKGSDRATAEAKEKTTNWTKMKQNFTLMEDMFHPLKVKT